jgi:hypothetical protein
VTGEWKKCLMKSAIIFGLRQKFEGDQIKVNEVGNTCSTHG